MCINLSIYLFMRKCIIFDIAFGEMHDLLDWKFYKHLSLILGELFEKVIGLLWVLKMLYHWFCCLRYVLETFKCLGIIWISDKLCEYFEYWKDYIFIMLTCKLFCCFTLMPWQLWLNGDYPAGCHLLVGLTKPLVESQPTCGPNEAPSSNTTYLWA